MASQKPYDWLGHGVYFWENDPIRAYQWACSLERKGDRPSILGAVIDLGRCLDLTTQEGIEAVRSAHTVLAAFHKKLRVPLPKNAGKENGMRLLDCAVIQQLHRARALSAKSNPAMPSYQTVRALFGEGQKLYTGAGFRTKTHVQICVSQRECLLGVFRLPEWRQQMLDITDQLY